MYQPRQKVTYAFIRFSRVTKRKTYGGGVRIFFIIIVPAALFIYYLTSARSVSYYSGEKSTRLTHQKNIFSYETQLNKNFGGGYAFVEAGSFARDLINGSKRRNYKYKVEGHQYMQYSL
jgi:hypothetical protein